MANAKKCDRCGVFYEKNTQFTKAKNVSKEIIDGMCFTTRTNNCVNYKDLCDDCLSKLYSFLDGKELKEDTDG